MTGLAAVTLAHIRGSGHGAGSATPIIDPFWQPLRCQDGKCVWWRNCSTENYMRDLGAALRRVEDGKRVDELGAVFWVVMRLRHGKVSRAQIHTDRAEALEAAGLSE